MGGVAMHLPGEHSRTLGKTPTLSLGVCVCVCMTEIRGGGVNLPVHIYISSVTIYLSISPAYLNWKPDVAIYQLLASESTKLSILGSSMFFHAIKIPSWNLVVYVLPREGKKQGKISFKKVKTNCFTSTLSIFWRKKRGKNYCFSCGLVWKRNNFIILLLNWLTTRLKQNFTIYSLHFAAIS